MAAMAILTSPTRRPHRRAGVRPPVVDARRALPEPAHRVRRQLDPQRRAPHALARPRRDRVAAPVGGRRRTRSCSPACCSRPARSATASDARARCSSGSPPSSSPPASRRRPPTMCADHRLPRGHGRRRRVHHAVDAVDPRERVPARASAPRRSRSGPTTTGVAGSIGPVISGWLLGHFWFGSVFLVNLPVIALAFVGGWFFVPKSRDPERERDSTRSARCSRSSASPRSSSGSSRRPTRDGARR